jgi:hypothetical protein
MEVEDYRRRIGTYPLWSLLGIYLLAALREAPRGSKDLAKFARRLSQDQRRALGIRQRHGYYPAPSQPTFWRLLEELVLLCQIGSERIVIRMAARNWPTHSLESRLAPTESFGGSTQWPSRDAAHVFNAGIV